MSEEKVYPAIYKAVDGNTFVYLDVKNYYSIERECWDVSNGDDNHATDKNITREYLANTYGEVVSPEHAEFIIELCKVNNIELSTRCANRDAKSFLFYPGGSMVIYKIPINELIIANEIKQITIPLPPKQIQTATPEEDFEMAQIEKNNGDNLMFGGADKCKEWPKIGDKVIAPFNNAKVKVTLCWQRVNNAGVDVSLVFDADSRPFWCATEDLEKPKTPEEELRDELESEIKSMIAFTNYNPRKIAEWIISGEIDGLSYNKKPQ